MPAVLAGSFSALKKRRGAARRSFFGWTAGKEADEEAKHWWRQHPRASDILIGWIQHPQLTQGNKIDLEVEFTTSSRGRWRSRGLGFKGPFEAKVARSGEASYLILEDSATVLRGRLEALSIQGSVTHENTPDGSFVLQALPECYHEWWSHVKGELPSDGSNPGILVFSEDGSIESGDSTEDLCGLAKFFTRAFCQLRVSRRGRVSALQDSADMPDITSPADLRKFLLRRLTQQAGSQRLLGRCLQSIFKPV